MQTRQMPAPTTGVCVLHTPVEKAFYFFIPAFQLYMNVCQWKLLKRKYGPNLMCQAFSNQSQVFQIQKFQLLRLTDCLFDADCIQTPEILLQILSNVLEMMIEICLFQALHGASFPSILLVSFLVRLTLSFLFCLIKAWVPTWQLTVRSATHIWRRQFAQNRPYNLFIIIVFILSCDSPLVYPIVLGSSFAGTILGLSGIWEPFRLEKLEKWNPPPGDLQARADYLVKTTGYSWSDIYVCPTLAKNMNAEACCHSGLRKTYILLDQGLLKKAPDTIIFVLAHELGHWKCKHSYRGFAATFVSSPKFSIFLLLIICYLDCSVMSHSYVSRIRA